MGNDELSDRNTEDIKYWFGSELFLFAAVFILQKSLGLGSGYLVCRKTVAYFVCFAIL